MDALEEVSFAGAIAGNSEVTERKVVTQWVLAVEAAELACDVDGHRPSGVFQLRQANITGNARDVRVERNHELSRPDLGPDAAVHAVVGPHHPPQVKVHALARASVGRRRKEEPHGYALGQLTPGIKALMTKTQSQRVKAVDRTFRVGVAAVKAARESALHRAMVFENPPDDPE